MSETQVVPEGTLPLAPDAPAEAVPDIELTGEGPQSPLDILKGKRAERDAKLHFDIAVPRWEDVIGLSIWVRYGPGDPSVFAEAMNKRDMAHAAKKKKDGIGDPEWATKANADLLVSACQGVYFLEPGEQPPDGDLPGDLPTFNDPALSAVLDAPRSAVGTVLKLYGTSADVLLAANQLLAWSGQASKESSEAFLSN